MDRRLEKGTHRRTDAGGIEKIDIAADQEYILEIEGNSGTDHGPQVIQIAEMIKEQMFMIAGNAIVFFKYADTIAVFFG